MYQPEDRKDEVIVTLGGWGNRYCYIPPWKNDSIPPLITCGCTTVDVLDKRDGLLSYSGEFHSGSYHMVPNSSC